MTDNCNGECSSCESSEGCNDKLQQKLSNIKNKVMVMSGKGGVGKSSVSVNVAAELTNQGYKVGLLDIDFHGPSIPVLLGIQGEQVKGTQTSIIPHLEKGIKVLSIGLMVSGEKSAVIWRGPMKANVIKQMIEDVEWGDLDYLIIDFPPGTGDEALSTIQYISDADGSIIVTTPQELSLADCRRCIDFCEKLKLPVLGVVENMSGFVCPQCNDVVDIFGSGGGEKMAFEEQVPYLGKIPMDKEFMELCDKGTPYMFEKKNTEVSKSYQEIVKSFIKNIKKGEK